MFNKDNYVPWSSRLLCYAKSKLNGKLIYNSITNGPYVRRMILEPGDLDREVPVAETFHEQTDDELTEKEAEVNELRAERLARAHDPLALMANSNNRYNYTVFHQDQPSSVTYMQQPQPNNNFILQPSFNMNYTQQLMPNPKDITDPTTAMNMALNGLIIVSGIANPNANKIRNGNVVVARAEGNANGNNSNQIRCYNYRGLGHLARNYRVRPRKRDAAYLQIQLLIAQKEEAGIQLQAEKFDFMDDAGDLDEIEEVNANCILMANL
nr:hypothetical protein [Tanacetum cinerariifolium]